MWDARTGYATRSTTHFQGKIACNTLACNADNVFAFFGDGCIMKYSLAEDGISLKAEGDFIKKKGSFLSVIATEEHLYVLYNDKSLEVLNIADYETVAAFDQPTIGNDHQINAMTLVKNESWNKNELWVSDSKGHIHFLEADTLKVIEYKTIEGKEVKTVYGHAGLCMAGNHDHTLVSIGDVKGHITTINTTTRDQVAYTAYHKNKVYDLAYSADDTHIYSIGQDKLSYLVNSANPDVKR